MLWCRNTAAKWMRRSTETGLKEVSFAEGRKMDDCPRNTECVACAEINEDFAEDGENFAYF